MLFSLFTFMQVNVLVSYTKPNNSLLVTFPFPRSIQFELNAIPNWTFQIRFLIVLSFKVTMAILGLSYRNMIELYVNAKTLRLLNVFCRLVQTVSNIWLVIFTFSQMMWLLI